MNVGLLKMPAFGDGAWADSLANTGNGFQVTQWSENKEVAGAFLAFLQQPENLQALYEATGNFPASTNWDPSRVRAGPTSRCSSGWARRHGLVGGELHAGRPRRTARSSSSRR